MKKTIGKIALVVALLVLATVCLTSCGSNEKKAEEVKDAVEQKVEEAKDTVEEAAATVEEKAEEAKETVEEAVEEVKETVEEKVDEAKDAVEEKVEEVKETVEETVEEAKDAVEETVDEAKEAVEEKAEEVKDAVEEAVAEIALMSHADYAAASADDQDPVYVETYVQATQSWWDNKITIYAQSKDGAYFIYNAACTEEDAAKLVPGTKIAVKGNKSAWSGEVEIIDATIEILDGDTFIADAFDATELLGKDELIDHQNEKVSFKGLTVVGFEYKNAAEKKDDIYLTLSKDGTEYSFCVEAYLTNEESDTYKAVEALNAGDVVDVEAFLYWYNGANPHVIGVTKAE